MPARHDEPDIAALAQRMSLSSTGSSSRRPGAPAAPPVAGVDNLATVKGKKAKAAAEARDRDTQATRGWRPEGRMVGHLAEHKMAVNKIVVSPDQRYFATASDDGTVRFWDCARLEGKAVTNESKQQFTKQVRPTFSLLSLFLRRALAGVIGCLLSSTRCVHLVLAVSLD